MLVLLFPSAKVKKWIRLIGKNKVAQKPGNMGGNITVTIQDSWNQVYPWGRELKQVTQQDPSSPLAVELNWENIVFNWFLFNLIKSLNELLL